MDKFTKEYIECALWSSCDGSGIPLDNAYSIHDLAPETLIMMRDDCKDFQAKNHHLLDNRDDPGGHDFWLTRNHHGAGFWDGDWANGKELTDAAHEYGECNLYVGDDGKIYC